MLIFTDDCYNGGDPETDDLAVIKSIIKGYIDAYAASKRIKLAGLPSPELAAWPLKLAEAKAGGGPMLQIEADTRGIPLDLLVEKVIANAQGYEYMEALIAGNAGKQRDIVSSLTTREELLAYDWRFEV
jgi:hypothetical protein